MRGRPLSYGRLQTQWLPHAWGRCRHPGEPRVSQRPNSSRKGRPSAIRLATLSAAICALMQASSDALAMPSRIPLFWCVPQGRHSLAGWSRPRLLWQGRGPRVGAHAAPAQGPRADRRVPSPAPPPRIKSLARVYRVQTGLKAWHSVGIGGVLSYRFAMNKLFAVKLPIFSCLGVRRHKTPHDGFFGRPRSCRTACTDKRVYDLSGEESLEVQAVIEGLFGF